MRFEEFVKAISERINSFNYQILEEKSINYGYQLKIAKPNSLKKDAVSVNLYFSTKKPDFSIVVGVKSDNPNKGELDSIVDYAMQIQSTGSVGIGIENNLPRTQKLAGSVDVSKNEKSSIPANITWNCYGGSDEAGKGDYFGPLVVCAFVANRLQFDDLRKMGVKDSKALSPREIYTVAESLIRTYSNQFQIMKLMPAQYNKLYDKFKQTNKNLNHLLAWAHARNILDIQSKVSFEGFLIDQFSSKELVKTSLSEMKALNIIQKTKAESDPCVAAASIIARYYFVQAIDQLSHQYNFILPKGAGSHVKQALQDFQMKFGEDELKNVAKLHFKV